VFLICFSVTSRASFANVEPVWVNEMNTHCANTPFVLCGTKVDCLDDAELVKKLKAEGNPPITQEEGEKLAKKLGAYGYRACSGKTQKGLLDVFELCAEAGLIKQGIIKPTEKNDKEGNTPPKKKDCLLQ
jgi:GTPase SAR1 family protein